MVANSISQISPASPEKKNKWNKTRRKRTNKEKTAGLLDFKAEILQTDKFWTEMILAGNQRKQRGPLHINLKNQDGVRQRQSLIS